MRDDFDVLKIACDFCDTKEKTKSLEDIPTGWALVKVVGVVVQYMCAPCVAGARKVPVGSKS